MSLCLRSTFFGLPALGRSHMEALPLPKVDLGRLVFLMENSFAVQPRRELGNRRRNFVAQLNCTRFVSTYIPRSLAASESNVGRAATTSFESVKSAFKQRITIEAAVEKYLADAK